MSNLQEGSDTSTSTLDTIDERSKEKLFDPPLYKQRYFFVCDLIKQFGAKHVIDMGCSEGKFLKVIKDMCPDVEMICGVDIDRSILEWNNHRVKPVWGEYVFRRKKPLIMRLIHGSITLPDLNYRSIDFVSCIEVIEHLHAEDLIKVPHALFYELQPKSVVITTPNKEYNVLFTNPSKMRHWDHKFEWTRKEFKDWCNNIVKLYSYTVEYEGIGKPPDEHIDVGYCSQAAIFKRISQHNSTKTFVKDTSGKSSVTVEESLNKQLEIKPSSHLYEVIEECVYPYDNRTREERILQKASYYINFSITEEDDDEDIRSISVQSLMTLFQKSDTNGFIDVTIDELTDVTIRELTEILESNFKLSEDKTNVLVRSDNEEFWSEDDLENEDNYEGRDSKSDNVVVSEPEEYWC